MILQLYLITFDLQDITKKANVKWTLLKVGKPCSSLLRNNVCHRISCGFTKTKLQHSPDWSFPNKHSQRKLPWEWNQITVHDFLVCRVSFTHTINFTFIVIFTNLDNSLTRTLADLLSSDQSIYEANKGALGILGILQWCNYWLVYMERTIVSRLGCFV